MKTIHYINGETQEISQETANQLQVMITREAGCGPLQFFSEGDFGEGDVVIMINTTQINFIK